jgi:hypothetical protein
MERSPGACSFPDPDPDPDLVAAPIVPREPFTWITILIPDPGPQVMTRRNEVMPLFSFLNSGTDGEGPIIRGLTFPTRLCRVGGPKKKKKKWISGRLAGIPCLCLVPTRICAAASLSDLGVESNGRK